MKLTYDASLRPYNTFGIEARAACLVEYDTAADLVYFLEEERTKHPSWPLLHIGGGSNLLFLDDYNGYVLRSTISGVEALPQADGSILVRAGAGIEHDALVANCVQQGWYGLENLSLIPGQVGAAAVQNIGAYGVETGDLIARVEAVELETGTTRIFTPEECAYAYRSSIFKTTLKGQYAITAVTYRLTRTFRAHLGYGGILQHLEQRGLNPATLTALDLRNTIIAIRQEKLPDPKFQGNAGSFFMNPVVEKTVHETICQTYPDAPSYEVDAQHVKVPAGWLIEHSGWKGRALGRAAVHDRQALVLVNKGGATGDDVMQLCRAVQNDVYKQFGIHLKPEVNIISATKVIFLGTGTSCGVPFIGCTCPVCTSTDSRDKRLRTSVLIQSGLTNILLDCGPDLRQQMLRIKFCAPIDAVCISHEHYDHVGGIDDLRPLSHLRDIPMYADPFCAQHLRERLPYCLLDHHYPGIPRLLLNDIRPHESVECGDIRITALSVMHGKLPILGYRVGDIAYITDMTEMPDTELDLLQGIRLLIINALRQRPHNTHQTLAQALEFRRRANLENVPTYFIHMSHDMGLHADVDSTLPPLCHLAYDGLVVKA